MICCKCRRDVPEGRFCILCGADQTPTSKKRKALKRANGTGTVYKLSGRRRRPWVAANDKIIIGYYDTKTAAIEALNRLTDVSLTDRYNYTFAQVFDKWSSEYYDTVGDSATVIYDIAYKVFTPLHNEKFRNLRTSDFQAVINAHTDKSHSTLSKYKSLVNLMSQWALREEIITSNFAQYVTLPPAQKKEKPIFTAEEIARIEAEAEHDETARIVCMLLATGMRIGELFHLPLEDYHETYVVGGSKTKAGTNRIIPIRPEGKKHFEYFAKKSAGMHLLLDGYEGSKRVSTYRDTYYYRLLDRLGIDRAKTPHSTRHTYVSRAVRENMRPEYLGKILGHADYSTTVETYTHIDAVTLVNEVVHSAGQNG